MINWFHVLEYMFRNAAVRIRKFFLITPGYKDYRITLKKNIIIKHNKFSYTGMCRNSWWPSCLRVVIYLFVFLELNGNFYPTSIICSSHIRQWECLKNLLRITSSKLFFNIEFGVKTWRLVVQLYAYKNIWICFLLSEQRSKHK